MFNRRELLFAGAAVLSLPAAARAADGKSQYPELTFAVVPAENASGVGERYAAFTEYLSKQLGVPVSTVVDAYRCTEILPPKAPATEAKTKPSSAAA